ncbi:Methionine aminopeptidase 2 [Rhizophlyctis rosea]|uniref:Methionine aminopeptidase 2 n=1 Tax=Rhizophlyctis rosea TaxID=64517 RepID=A0AAD5SBD7_9FUNG|nr:Methionine aminopeptidase 2 [Rhizophlyctis rosea]
MAGVESKLKDLAIQDDSHVPEGEEDEAVDVTSTTPSTAAKKNKKKKKKTANATAETTEEPAPPPTNGNVEGLAEQEDAENDDEEEDGAAAEGEAGGDEAAKKKKKKKKSKKKSATASGAGAANGTPETKIPTTQTSPPTIPVSRFFPNNIYPEGELCDYKDDNTYRTTSEEHRYSERLLFDHYNDLRRAAEVHRQVRQYARTAIKPGMSMIEIAELIENGTRGLVEEKGLEADWQG